MIPCSGVHEDPDITPILNKSIWKQHPSVLLVRYTTDFDLSHETNWWYVIKDTPFDLSELKAKRRYEINKGNKYFDVREIVPSDYKEEIWEVLTESLKAYPDKYRAHFEHDSYMETIQGWNCYKAYGAFCKESGRLCGYSVLERNGRYISFALQKTIPQYEHLAINAALVYKIVVDHNSFFESGGYICDGSRSINHETAFQDYLEKYFEFRKAYCRLHVVYKPIIGVIVKLIYPFRKLFTLFDNIKSVHLVNGIMTMEEIVRDQNK